MKNKIYTFLPILVILFNFVLACSMAPLSNHYTGRSFGENKVGAEAGGTANMQLASTKIGFGLTKNFDFHIQYEPSNVAGVLGKYSLINSQEFGFSLAVVGSLGLSGTGNYYYGALVASYLMGAFEPFCVVRYNAANYRKSSWEIGSLGTASTPTGNYNFLYYTLGTNLWFSPWIGLSFEGSMMGDKWPGHKNKAIFSLAILIRP